MSRLTLTSVPTAHQQITPSSSVLSTSHTPFAHRHTSCAAQTPPYNYTVPCVKATTAQITKGLTPATFPALTLAKSPALPEDPPPIPGYCNSEMPNDSTLNRYVWTVAQFVNEVLTSSAPAACKICTPSIAQGMLWPAHILQLIQQLQMLYTCAVAAEHGWTHLSKLCVCMLQQAQHSKACSC